MRMESCVAKVITEARLHVLQVSGLFRTFVIGNRKIRTISLQEVSLQEVLLRKVPSQVYPTIILTAVELFLLKIKLKLGLKQISILVKT